MSAAPAQHARYRWIDPADLVHLSPKDRFYVGRALVAGAR